MSKKGAKRDWIHWQSYKQHMGECHEALTTNSNVSMYNTCNTANESNLFWTLFFFLIHMPSKA